MDRLLIDVLDSVLYAAVLFLIGGALVALILWDTRVNPEVAVRRSFGLKPFPELRHRIGPWTRF